MKTYVFSDEHNCDHTYVLAADAQATVEALQRERDEWRSNAVAQEARANDLERDCKDLQSDIEDERAKAGNLSKKIAYWEKRHRTYKELAEENMNCKQASIDAHKDAYDELESQHADLHAALNAEREKVKGLEKAYDDLRADLNERDIPPADQQLSQLQTLVRAYFKARSGNDQNGYMQAYAALKATLDATTPAAKGGDGE